MAFKKIPVDRTPICDPRLPAADRPRVDSRSGAASLLGGHSASTGLPAVARTQAAVPLHGGLVSTHRKGHTAKLRGDAFAVLAVVGDRVLKVCFPQHDWQEWLFPQVQSGFWERQSNCRRYLDWLGAKLGYRCLDDWYGVSFWDFQRNKGTTLVNRHRGLPALVVMDLIPRRDWCEWRFLHVPPGFWEVAENRHRYLRWLGRELGLRRPTDWYRVRVEDIKAHFGEGLCGAGRCTSCWANSCRNWTGNDRTGFNRSARTRFSSGPTPTSPNMESGRLAGQDPLRERLGPPSTTAFGVAIMACQPAARWQSS